MKLSELKQIIREEIQNALNEEQISQSKLKKGFSFYQIYNSKGIIRKFTITKVDPEAGRFGKVDATSVVVHPKGKASKGNHTLDLKDVKGDVYSDLKKAKTELEKYTKKYK